MADKRKIDLLISFIERWLQASARRSIQMLSRQSGVPYQTVRRLMQRECDPSLETSMSILNLVSSLDEAMQFFSEDPSVNAFYQRIADRVSIANPDLLSKILGKDGFWTLMLAMTIGATRVNVEKLLGVLGAAEFEEMIEEGFLVESTTSGIYRANIEQAVLYIENKKLSREAVIHIAQMQAEDEAYERFLVYNVSEEGYRKMRAKFAETYRECDGIARESEGPVMVAFSLVGKQVISVPGKDY